MSKILVVDDSLTIRNLVKSLFEATGADVETAEYGVEGLEVFANQCPDLVIADVNMPRLNGVQMIEAIRQGNGDSAVPIVVLTTETSAEYKVILREAGASAWVAKPYNDDILLQVVGQFLH